MATFTGPSTGLGESLAEMQFFGSSDDLTVERTDCVSVSIARVENYRSAADLWRQLFHRELPDRTIQYADVSEMLRRTGGNYVHYRFDSSPGGKTAFEALHDHWLEAGNPTRFMFGLLFYTRHNQPGHCINFVNLGRSKRMLFLDFQMLQWSPKFSHAVATDCQGDVAQAQTIYIGFDSNRASFEHWEDDSDRRRQSRARKMVEDGYSPIGSVFKDERPLSFYSVYRYSSENIISAIGKKPIWKLFHEEADLLRDLGSLTARGRLLIRQWPRWVDSDGIGGDDALSFRVTTGPQSKWQSIPYEERRGLANYFADGYTGIRHEVLYNLLAYNDDDVDGRKGSVRTKLNPFPLSSPSSSPVDNSGGKNKGHSVAFSFMEATTKDLWTASPLIFDGVSDEEL